MARVLRLALVAGGLALCLTVRGEPQPAASVPLFQHPISRAEAVDIALRQNSSILKGKADLQAAYGVVVQLHSIAYPTVSAKGAYNRQQSTLIEQFPLPAEFANSLHFPDQNWNSEVRVQQSVYEGGRMISSFRSAKLTRQQALLNYQTVLADTLLSVRTAYDDVLVAAQQITVHEASVKLLSKELDEVERRYKAGTVPQLDVLRARVELANEKPRFIQARNDFRIGKNNLLNLLGCNLPPTVWEDVPLQLSDTLAASPLNIDLTAALDRALKQRPELAALKKAHALRHEDVVQARAGFKPSAQIFGGYQWESLPYENDLGQALYGWVAGAQISWNIFDSGLTRGKIMESQANEEKASLDIDESRRQIELDVRTAYSNLEEAHDVLESQKAVQEEAEEALRQAEARMAAGSATQLDVLNAQTALTQARTTEVQALHDYSVARSRMQRAVGDDMMIVLK